MLFDLFGVQRVEWSSKKTGLPMSASVLHLVSSADSSRAGFKGREAMNVFLMDSLGFSTLVNSFSLPCVIDIDYGPNNSIHGIKLVDSKK